MIHFNELRITPDEDLLIIDASIDKQAYFQNVLIDKILIDTQDTYSPNGPSNTPLYSYDAQQAKDVRLELNIQDLKVSPSDTMFFVYIVATGVPLEDTPSSLNKNIIMGTVISLKSIYKKALGYIKQVECSCEIPKNFIDLILRFKAIELCVRTGNYPQAIKYWKKFFMKGSCSLIDSNCNCYG